MLHTCQKSQLVAILEGYLALPESEPVADAIIIDGSALVNSLCPRTSNTFEEYAVLDVLPSIQRYSTKYQRTDIVFDVYQKCLRRVTSNGKIPSNWPIFLRENDNKTELFIFLADRIVEMCTANVVIATREEDFVSNRAISLEGVPLCSQEEADTRIFVYARQAAAEGSKVIMIKACDTYVLVMAVSCFLVLQALGLKKLDCIWART